jgi:hypothetical protein
MKRVFLLNVFLPWQSWICYHAKQIAETFHILQLFLSVTIYIENGYLESFITLVIFHIHFHFIASSGFN